MPLPHEDLTTSPITSHSLAQLRGWVHQMTNKALSRRHRALPRTAVVYSTELRLGLIPGWPIQRRTPDWLLLQQKETYEAFSSNRCSLGMCRNKLVTMLGNLLGRILGRLKIGVADVADREEVTEYPAAMASSNIQQLHHATPKKTPDIKTPRQYIHQRQNMQFQLSNLNNCKQFHDDKAGDTYTGLLPAQP